MWSLNLNLLSMMIPKYFNVVTCCKGLLFKYMLISLFSFRFLLDITTTLDFSLKLILFFDHVIFLISMFDIQWKQLIMVTLGPALFDNNNRLITLSGGATWCTIIYQYSTIREFLPLMEMRCVRPLPYLMTGQSSVRRAIRGLNC